MHEGNSLGINTSGLKGAPRMDLVTVAAIATIVNALAALATFALYLARPPE
jgi:hypothetical protein